MDQRKWSDGFIFQKDGQKRGVLYPLLTQSAPPLEAMWPQGGGDQLDKRAA